jgi:hypothetical protein
MIEARRIGSSPARIGVRKPLFSRYARRYTAWLARRGPRYFPVIDMACRLARL